jgi:aminomuconate-semialdehyde/2-hydroxymuconate-6-semialdehyde dehydrogenase
MELVRNTIDGAMVDPIGGHWIENVEPATGAVYGRIAASDELDVQAAVDAAERAFPDWRGRSAAERGALLHHLADAVEAETESLARMESIDNGKPIDLARNVDIPRAVTNLRFFADAGVGSRTETHVTEGAAINTVLREPIGVVGLISPWNLPLYLLTWKIAPALIMGNTCVAKPSELTPVTAARLGELAIAVGFPPGVLNIIHGSGQAAGEAIVTHPRIRAVSFTGGTETGARIATAAAPHFKKLSLELGGKNPNIIFEDADLDTALRTSLQSSFANQGQICLCGSRILAHHAVYDRVVESIVAGAKELRIGDPLEDTTQQGALVSQAHRDKVAHCVDLARNEGGDVLCGGSAPGDLPERCRGGFFYEPTVITGLPMDAQTNTREIFGPVVTITPFASQEEAIEMANATDYGLSASIWTTDADRIHAVAAGIEAGTVWVNCWMLRDLRVPFGGVKHSGVGREGGEDGMRFFTEPKTICEATST